MTQYQGHEGEALHHRVWTMRKKLEATCVECDGADAHKAAVTAFESAVRDEMKFILRTA